MSILNPFYDAIGWLVIHFQNWLSFLGPNWSWALAIVLLTLFMRVLLIPLFVKQIKSQRAMTALQPQIKALQAKHKNDKQRLNEEMMKLWREAGVNPLMGCLPLIPQIPIFFALFHTLDKLRPTLECPVGVTSCSNPTRPIYNGFGQFSSGLVESAAHAKIFGVPIAAAFNSDSGIVHALDSSVTNTRILCAILTLIMVATTFLTQRQMLARNAASGQSQIAGQQKVLLYVLPLLFLVYGYRFPVGVLLYWLTTNLWSLGQQFFVLRRMDTAAAAPADPPAAAPQGPAVGAKPARPKGINPSTSATPLPATGDGSVRPPTRPTPGARPKPGNAARAKRKRRR